MKISVKDADAAVFDFVCEDCKERYPLSVPVAAIRSAPQIGKIIGQFVTCARCQQEWRWEAKQAGEDEIEVDIQRRELPAFPDCYRPGPRSGLELPLYWRDEQGDLPKVIAAFVNHGAGHLKEIYPAQVELTRRYIEYFLKAPCWRSTASDAGTNEDLDAAIAAIGRAKTPEDIRQVIEATLKLGIDPL